MEGTPKNPVVKEAFKACQDSFAVHPKLIKRLKAYYIKNDPDRFFASFMYYLKFPISGYVERSVFVDRTLEFVAKFACAFLEKDEKEGAGEKEESVSEKAAGGGEEEDEELPLFLYRLFAWLLDHHEVEGADARLRVCQLLNKLLKYMGEEACIDDELYNKIYDGMLERLKDRVAEIRSQAVTALQRLQDPKDEECPIIKAYLFHLAHDPNTVVRRTIVRCIGATRLTLPHVLERTRDTDDNVRRAAYKFIAEKVHIKSLTIGQREGLLQRGLGERSEPVRRVVEHDLLPAWLRLSGDNIVQLLHHLDVGNSDQEPADRRPGTRPCAPVGALNVLFDETSPRDLVTQFQYLGPDRLVPYDKLTAETAMYWRVLAHYLREEGAEDCLELLLPELTPFCQYVRRYVLEMEKENEDLNWEFVAKELITITRVFDLADETGRQHLVSLVKALLTSTKTPVSFIPALVEVFARVEKDPQSRVNQVAEVISELKDPMQKEGSSTDEDMFFDAVGGTPSPKKNAAAVQAEREIMAKQMEVARLRVAMNEAREELSRAVAGQDFVLAQEVKGSLDGLEAEQAAAEEEVRVLKGTVAASPAVPQPAEPTSVPDSDEETEDGGAPDGASPTVTLKCLKLLTATLQDPKITSLNATLHTLMETFVTVSVQSEMAAIRREAIVALCCLCLRSLDSARQHMLLLLQAAHIDVHEVRLAAISAVVDLLMRHGLPGFITSGPAEELDHSGAGSEATASRGAASQCDSLSTVESFVDSDSSKGATLTQTELNSQGGNSVVAILTKILDEPDLELRTETAEGLCKLLMIGAISSPKLLSRLLLIWYNPMTEPSCKLRHILGTFFPLYCSMSRASQLAMEGAFIPTMRVLFDAPITSPLNEIDVEDVGMFFVHLTKEDMLQSHDASKRPVDVLAASTTSVHDSLAKIVSNEILQYPDAYQAKVLIKVLTNLQLTSNNFVHLRELRVLSAQLLVTVKERLAVRQLEKFDKLLTEWLAKDPSARPRSPSVNKRRSSAAVTEEEENQADLTAGQSPGRKRRVLFSQSQGTLLDPTSPLGPTRQVDAGSEEEELEEVAAQERSTIPSPVAAAEGTAEPRRSHGDDASASFSAVMSSTRLSRGSDEEEEAEVTVVAEEVVDEERTAVSEAEEEVEVTTGRGRRVPAVRVIQESQSEEDEPAVEPLEVLSATDSEDDIFSDASSVASVNVSKLPKGLIGADSTDSEDEPTPRPRGGRTRPAPKASAAEEEAEEEETAPKARGRPKKTAAPQPSEEAPKARGGRGKKPAGKGLQDPQGLQATSGTSSRSSASSRSSVSEGSALPASPGLSRSGRSNSPRIDYKTGKPVGGGKAGTPEPTRKRGSARREAAAPASSTSSPNAKTTRSSRK